MFLFVPTVIRVLINNFIYDFCIRKVRIRMVKIDNKLDFLDMVDDRLLKKDKIYVASHGDADGISAAWVTAYAYRKQKPDVYFPDDFKETKSISGKDADIVTDKVPYPEYQGLVVDHHPDHKKDASYALYHGDIPASGMALDLFGNMIPRHLHWKAVPGIIGDGQPEKIPPYIWKEFPILSETVGTIRKYKGNTNIYHNPLWFLLSSPLNSACRVGKRNLAFSVLASARTPYDIINNPSLAECKMQVKKEVDRVRMENRCIDLGKIVVFVVNSLFSVHSTMAWEINGETKKTAIVLNEGVGRGSIRGVLVDYLKEYIDPKWGIGGHSGFAGISLPKPQAEGEDYKIQMKQTVEDFIEALRELENGK